MGRKLSLQRSVQSSWDSSLFNSKYLERKKKTKQKQTEVKGILGNTHWTCQENGLVRKCCQRRQHSAQSKAVSWPCSKGGTGNRKLKGTRHEHKLLPASTWDTHSHCSHGSQRGKTVTLGVKLPQRDRKRDVQSETEHPSPRFPSSPRPTLWPMVLFCPMSLLPTSPEAAPRPWCPSWR